MVGEEEEGDDGLTLLERDADTGIGDVVIDMEPASRSGRDKLQIFPSGVRRPDDDERTIFSGEELDEDYASAASRGTPRARTPTSGDGAAPHARHLDRDLQLSTTWRELSAKNKALVIVLLCVCAGFSGGTVIGHVFTRWSWLVGNDGKEVPGATAEELVTHPDYDSRRHFMAPRVTRARAEQIMKGPHGKK
eukprot:g9872.t1